jgi:hypothetical protein
VATIDVTRIDDDFPVLSWTHPGGNLAGYDVYMGPPDQSVKVTAAPITDLSLIDGGFANDVRDYRVIAVDVNAEQSPARTIRLPKVSAQPVTGSRLRRGFMNQLDYQVHNQSGMPLDNLQIIARRCSIASGSLACLNGYGSIFCSTASCWPN